MKNVCKFYQKETKRKNYETYKKLCDRIKNLAKKHYYQDKIQFFENDI